MSQSGVYVYFTSKQMLYFGFAEKAVSIDFVSIVLKSIGPSI